MASNGPSNSVLTLTYAEQDGADVAAALRSPQCEFTVTAPTPELSKTQVLTLLEASVRACKREDTFVCYFAGHGILEKGKLYLVWAREDLQDDLLSASLPVSFIREYMDQCPAYNKLLILDCCHAGAAAGVRNNPGGPMEEVVGPPAENYVVLCASERLEPTRELEDFRGSFLKQGIKDALTDSFNEADFDKDRRISLADLQKWLEWRWDRLNSAQKVVVPRPHRIGKESGPLYLTSSRTSWLPFEIPWSNGMVMVVLPLSPVFGKALCISKHPVTNEQYQRYTRTTRHRPPKGHFLPPGRSGSDPDNWAPSFRPWKHDSFNDPDQPVVCVSYHDAKAYSRWVDSSSRRQPTHPGRTILPTKRVWHYAAFGVDSEGHRTERDQWLSASRAIHHRSDAPVRVDDEGPRWNTWGVSDMVGNVWEWCADAYYVSASGYVRYYLSEEEFDARQMSDRTTLDRRVAFRGGGFLDDMTQTSPFLEPNPVDLRTKHFDLGFRTAGVLDVKDLPDEQQLRIRFQPHPSDEMKAALLAVLLEESLKG
jgi:formylglycine-generating enzyme required for sulfatase activity